MERDSVESEGTVCLTACVCGRVGDRLNGTAAGLYRVWDKMRESLIRWVSFTGVDELLVLAPKERQSAALLVGTTAQFHCISVFIWILTGEGRLMV